MKRFNRAKVALLLALGGAVAFACTEGSLPVVPTHETANTARAPRGRDPEARTRQLAARRAKYLTPHLEAKLEGAEARLNPAARARMEAARERVAWLGKLHMDVMREADGMVRPLRMAGKHDKALTCRVIEHSLKSARGKMRAGGHYAENAWTRADDERQLKAAGCISATRLSVLALNMPEPGPALAEEEGDTVTGEFRPYLDDMQAAVRATDGSPSSVAAAANAVLATAAAGLTSTPDLEVVAGAAEVAISSAQGWNPQTYDYMGDVAARCLADPYGFGHQAPCQQLCQIQYIPSDSCNQWEMMLMAPNFWLAWADWSDVAWDLVSHDLGGGTFAGNSKLLEWYWAGVKATSRKVLAAFGVGAVGGSILRWLWIMEQ